jgi:adenylosuccinate lyase
MLARLDVIMSGLELDPERMRNNIRLSEGMIGSESLMLALGEKIGRQQAHDVVFDVAQTAAVSDTPFLELLTRDPDAVSADDVDRAHAPERCGVSAIASPVPAALRPRPCAHPEAGLGAQQ